jgi:rubrerythrin
MKQKEHYVCLGCGLIYEGGDPPDVCPICGAPKRCFYPRQYMPSAPTITPVSDKKLYPPPAPGKKHWVCLGCGLIKEGNEPPATCPVCGAPKNLFMPRENI